MLVLTDPARRPRPPALLRLRGTALPVCLALLLLPIQLYAQEAEAQPPGAGSTELKVLVLPALPFSPDTLADAGAVQLGTSIAPLISAGLDSPDADVRIERSLVESWATVLTQRGPTVPSALSAEVPDLDNAALQAARESSADVVLLSFYEPQSTRMLVLSLAYDAWRGRIIAAQIERPRASIRFTTELDALALSLGDAIREDAETLVAGRDGVRGEPVFVSLELRAELDGMRVSVAGRGELGEIADGRLELPRQPFVAGQQVIFELSHPRHYPGTASVQISAEDSVVELPVPPRMTRLVVDARYDTAMPLGGQVGLLWHLVPDRTVIGARLGFGVLAPSPADLALGVPELETGLRFGVYPLPNRTAAWRLRLETGVALRSIFTDAGVLIDPRLVIVDATVQRFLGRLSFGIGSALSVRVPIGNSRASGAGLFLSSAGLMVGLEVGYRW